jgi:hypothetical protein
VHYRTSIRTGIAAEKVAGRIDAWGRSATTPVGSAMRLPATLERQLLGHGYAVQAAHELVREQDGLGRLGDIVEVDVTVAGGVSVEQHRAR